MSQQSLAVASSIESVVKSRYNGPLIRAAAELWIGPADLVVDVTYGKGNFWTEFQPERFVKHDLHTVDGVDFRELPEADASCDVIVFDPPYIPQGGRETSGMPEFLDRYGLMTVPSTNAALRELIAAGIVEAARVLAPSGRLMVKCMDYINGSAYQAMRHFVVATAIEAGLVQVDGFVHHSGLGPPARRQLHSRRAHSYLCVFQKPKARRRARIDTATTGEIAATSTDRQWPDSTLQKDG